MPNPTQQQTDNIAFAPMDPRLLDLIGRTHLSPIGYMIPEPNPGRAVYLGVALTVEPHRMTDSDRVETIQVIQIDEEAFERICGPSGA